MWLQGEFQLWQAVAVTAMAVLGAAMGAWCAQAALAYARLLDAGAHADAGSLLTALRIAGRRRPAAILGDASSRVSPTLKLFSAILLVVVFGRSEGRRVGKEWVSTCRSRGSPLP